MPACQDFKPLLEVPNYRKQAHRIVGLCDVEVASGSARFGAVLFIAVSRHRNNGNVLEARLAFQAPADFVTVEARQAEVEQHDVRPELLRDLRYDIAIDRELDDVAVVLEQDREGLEGVQIVLDDENSADTREPARGPALRRTTLRAALDKWRREMQRQGCAGRLRIDGLVMQGETKYTCWHAFAAAAARNSRGL